LDDDDLVATPMAKSTAEMSHWPEHNPEYDYVM
jgi:hypothetical protein